LTFNRSGLFAVDAVRMAFGTTVPLAIGVAAGSWASGAAAAGGALAVGITSVVPSFRPQVAALTAIAVGIALGTFIGSASSSYPVLHVIVGAIVAFLCGLLVAVEPAYAGSAINALIGFLVYGRFSAPPEVAARTASLVLVGALFQLLVVVLVRRRPHAGRALAGLGRAYKALADFATTLDVDRSSLRVAQEIDAAMTDLDFSLRVDAAGEAWTSLAGEARRVRIELLSLASARSNIKSVDDEKYALLTKLGTSVSRYLQCVAESLTKAEVSAEYADRLDDVGRVLDDLNASADDVVELVRSHDEVSYPFIRAVAAARALGGQLRAVGTLLPDAVDARTARLAGVAAVRSASRVSRRGVRGAKLITQRMLANMTPRSDAFRHALRLAVVVTIATAIAHGVSLGRGYWLALTAVVVLRPEFSITFSRGVARAVGTFVGVGLATVVAVLAHPHGWALLPFVACFVWLTGVLFNANYIVYSVAITGVVVFLLAGLDPNPVTDGEDRLVATVLGAALALIAYAAFPTWGRRPASEALAELATTTHKYALAVLRSYLNPGVQLGSLSRAVRLARTNTESALNRSLADPGRRRPDSQISRELLAAMRRVAIAAHTLRLRRPAEPFAWQPGAERAFVELIDAIGVELGGIAARLRFGRIAYRHEALRDRHRAFVVALTRKDDDNGRPLALDEGSALLVAETDEIVDAVNTLNATLDQLSVQAFVVA
jgi:uncharacterized membrane protein YccC